MSISFSTATNAALAPHLYEAEILNEAIDILARERDLNYEQARRFGMHHPHGKSAARNGKRFQKMINACKKAAR